MPSSRPPSPIRRAETLSSSRTGTWMTSLTGEVLFDFFPPLSQGEVLHPWRHVRRASSPQALEARVPGLEIPDFEMAALAHEHHLAGDVGVVAQHGRDQQTAGAVGLDFLGETHEEPLPEIRLAIEAGKRHDLRPDGFPGGQPLDEPAAHRM